MKFKPKYKLGDLVFYMGNIAIENMGVVLDVQKTNANDSYYGAQNWKYSVYWHQSKKVGGDLYFEHWLEASS